MLLHFVIFYNERFITLFSIGYAVVLEDKAALWTDGRYFLQAENELDCNWILMKDGCVIYSTVLLSDNFLFDRKQFRINVLFSGVKLSNGVYEPYQESFT